MVGEKKKNNIRAEINDYRDEKDNRKTQWKYELVLCKDKCNDKPLVKLTRKKKRGLKIRNDTGKKYSNWYHKIQSIIGEFYANKSENLEEKVKFLDTVNLSKLYHESIKNHNRLVVRLDK